MSSNYIFGIVVYVVIAVAQFASFAGVYLEEDDPTDKKDAAIIALLAPVWPLPLVGAILFVLGYGGYHLAVSVPRAFRFIKEMFNTAIGREGK